MVTTAIPLDDELRAHITDDLRQITGKRILLREQVDPTILGGAIARVGDTLIDGSLRRRFQLLRQQILQGSFGGSEDGADTSLADLGGPDGGGGAGGAGGGASDGGAPASGGPSMATERTARPTDQPHLGPKPSTADTGKGSGTGADSGTDRRSGRSNTNKRRRR